MGYIYKITNPINMIYVGQTVSIRKRILSYKRYEFESSRHKGIINDSFLTFGFKAHTFQILEMNVDVEDLSEREQYWINKLNTLHSVNPSGMNGNDYDSSTFAKTKGVVSKDFFEGFEEWGFKSFTGEEFLEKTKKLRSQYTSYVNKKHKKNFPQWAKEKCWAKLKKKILCYDINGDFICEYTSSTDAAKILGIPRSSIKDSLKWGSWSRAKYMFKYWEENYPLKIEVGQVTVQGGLKPVLLLNNEWKLIKEYESPIKAADDLGASAIHIRRLASEKGLKMLKNSYRFVYKEDYGSLNPSEMEGGIKK